MIFIFCQIYDGHGRARGDVTGDERKSYFANSTIAAFLPVCTQFSREASLYFENRIFMQFTIVVSVEKAFRLLPPPHRPQIHLIAFSGCFSSCSPNSKQNCSDEKEQTQRKNDPGKNGQPANRRFPFLFSTGLQQGGECGSDAGLDTSVRMGPWEREREEGA
jgi:hypothetical protein